jgi:hypothetical protein
MSKSETRDALHGVGYGVVQGADEVRGEVGEAASEVARGALEAAEKIGPLPSK